MSLTPFKQPSLKDKLTNEELAATIEQVKKDTKDTKNKVEKKKHKKGK